MPYFCAARVPHITICTFRGGVPKDSNNITEWRNINPIMVKGVLMKVLRRKGSRVFMLFASCNGKELKVYNR